MRQSHTPINFDFMMRGMRDKSPKSDEKSPAPRKLVNFDAHGEFMEPRASVKQLWDFGEPVIELHVDGSDMYVFTSNSVWHCEFDYVNKVMLTQTLLGTYTGCDYVDVEMYQRETDVLFTGNVTVSEDQYIEVGAAGTLNREEWIGKVLRLNNGTHTEDILISMNTDMEIEVDGYIEHDYTGSTFEILETERTIYFTNGTTKQLFRVEGTTIADTGHKYDHIGIHAGRLFAARNKNDKEAEPKIVFTNTGCLYFPRQQEAFIDPADGVFMGFENFFESLVVMMQYGIYTISGQFPEEMIPEKRLSEDVNIRGKKAWVAYNGVMYLMTHRGFEAFNRLETQAQPESRPLTFNLEEKRFYSDQIINHCAMGIFENKVLTQMRDYVLVHDTDMSIITEESWFGEYRDMAFYCMYTENNTTFLGTDTVVCWMDPTERACRDYYQQPIDWHCEVTGNILEYGQRDIRKLWRDVVFYQTWKERITTYPYQEFRFEGRNVPWVADVRNTDLRDEEHYYCSVESPYLRWHLKMSGNFTLEDIIFYFKPNKLYAKSHVT